MTRESTNVVDQRMYRSGDRQSSNVIDRRNDEFNYLETEMYLIKEVYGATGGGRKVLPSRFVEEAYGH